MPEIKYLRPVRNLVLIGPFPGAERSEGGLLIASSTKRPVMRGMVLGIGPGTERKDGKFAPVTACNPGDIVLYSTQSQKEVKVDGEQLVLVEDTDILGKLVKEESVAVDSTGG